MTQVLNPLHTAERLPWADLVGEIALVLQDTSVSVSPRLVQALGGGASLFVMPAVDSCIAIAKLITFTPANQGTNRPVIQGDVTVFDIATGQRRLILDGPTVTARRTAAVSVLAAERLACDPQGPLLIVGAGVQGKRTWRLLPPCWVLATSWSRRAAWQAQSDWCSMPSRWV